MPVKITKAGINAYGLILSSEGKSKLTTLCEQVLANELKFKAFHDSAVWDPDNHHWIVPISRQVAEQLEALSEPGQSDDSLIEAVAKIFNESSFRRQ